MTLVYVANSIFAIVLCLIVAHTIVLHKDINQQFDMITSLAMKVADLKKNQDEIQAKHTELMEAEDTAENRIAAKIEKRWDEGLSQMLAFNPFAQELEGDNR